MKIWITKYALTQGIIEVEDYDNCLETDPTGDMISVKFMDLIHISMERVKTGIKQKNLPLKEPKK